MTNWILENKEWIFSGIGVAIVALIVAAVRKVFSKKRTCVNTKSRETTNSINGVPKTKTKEVEAKGVRSDLTPNDIVKAITSVPPLQQKDIAKHYQGIRVRWSGVLGEISEIASGPRVLVALQSGDVPPITILFYVDDPADHKGFSLVDIGQTITVEGYIKEAGHSVLLENVELSF